MNIGQNQEEEFTKFANKLADVSGEILRRASSEIPDTQTKQDNSLVTETDKAIEKRMREMINEKYPDHGILGEEFGNERLDAEHVWVLDPIDGTLDFIAGIPVFGTLIGLAREGRPWLGIIDHPITDERWFGISKICALRNGSPVRTRKCSDLSTALTTCYGTDTMDQNHRARFARLKEITGRSVYGGGCYTYGMVSSGRVDLVVDYGFDPYDVYAPIAVIEGAGGVATDWNGNPVDFNWRGSFIAAGDENCHKMALRQMNM